MLKNYFVVALRTLQRRKSYALLNVMGLALGVACCGLIGLYVFDEGSYDRVPDAGRIFRLEREWEPIPGRDDRLRLATTPPALMPLLREQFPELQDGFRLLRFGDAPVRAGDQEFRETRVYFAEPAVFDLFDVPLLAGDPRTALAEPLTIVVSASMAKKYFGDADPVGQTLTLYGDGDFRVTGVMADAPAQRHVHFDFVASWGTVGEWLSEEAMQSWYNNRVYVYVRLPDGDPARVAALEKRLEPFMDTYEPEGNETNVRLMPLRRIHLHSALPNELEPNGNATTVSVFAGVALLVLLLACVNFMNLSTARSAERAREVGVRKVLGAQRQQLVGQFLSESVVLAGGALLVGMTLIRLLLPVFEDVSGKTLEGYGWGAIGGFALLALGAGLAAGSYPALVLSGLRPVRVLRGGRAGAGGALLRKGLVVFQFAASVALIAGTLVVHGQVRYMKGKALGFDRERIVQVELPDQALFAQGAALEEAFERVPQVEEVAFTTAALPGGIGGGASFWRREWNYAEGKGVQLSTLAVSDDFAEAIGIRVVAGRFLSRAFASDTAAAVLNETAARRLGFTDPEQAVGEVLEPSRDSYGSYGRYVHVVGVVNDFHVGSLQEEVPNAAFFLLPATSGRLLVRLAGGDLPAALAGMEQAWKAVAGDRGFEYQFTDQLFDALYRAEERTGDLLTLFALLAVFIACLGLFGLAAYTAEQRTKEIGVRKVLGASVGSLVGLLVRDFTRLVLLAALVAAPLVYLLARGWLDDFAYRIPLGPLPFVAAGGAALLLAAGTVGYHALRAATTDPVKSLRYE